MPPSIRTRNAFNGADTRALCASESSSVLNCLITSWTWVDIAISMLLATDCIALQAQSRRRPHSRSGCSCKALTTSLKWPRGVDLPEAEGEILDGVWRPVIVLVVVAAVCL